MPITGLAVVPAGACRGDQWNSGVSGSDMADHAAVGRVSVVIPTYNRRALIARAVRSALDQTLAPFEVIVVDDASADGSAEELLGLAAAHPEVRPIVLDRNVGGGGARNAGIDAARGDIVAFLDVDDEWQPDHLRRMSELLAGMAQPGVVSARVAVLEEGHRREPGEAARALQFRGGAAVANYMLTHAMAFQTSTLVLPAALAKRVRFDARLRRHQDWDFVIRLAGSGASIVHARSTTVIYHAPVNQANVSRSRSLMPSWRFLARHRPELSARAFRRFRVLEVDTRRRNGRLLPKLLFAFLMRAISWPELLHYAVYLPRAQKRNA